MRRLATIHNAVDRQQTDKAIAIGCLRSSIDGLKINVIKVTVGWAQLVVPSVKKMLLLFAAA